MKELTQPLAQDGAAKGIQKQQLLPSEYKILKQHLSKFFQTKVQLTCSPKGSGKISISFKNEEELERIMGMLDVMKG